MDNSRNRPNEYLGVNKIGKNIRKNDFVINNNSNSNSNSNTPARQQPQPQVYNISKNDFRSIVQQLTGSPSRNNGNDPLPRPPINPPPKHPSMRLQRIRPPPLTPINRPPAPPVVSHHGPMQPHPYAPGPSNFGRPPPPPPRSQFGQPSPRGVQQFAPGGSGWVNPALSPISAYMQQLQSCISEGGHTPLNQGHPQMQFHGQAQGLRPTPSAQQPLASPRTNGGPAPFPSPTSQFQLPSPSWFNMLSPTQRSPYPLLSPGNQFPPPLSPNFAFPPPLSPNFAFPPPLSPNFAFPPSGQPGTLGPSPHLPLSPGMAFPVSPSGFFSFPSPRWRGP